MPLANFYQVLPGAPNPVLADKTLAGTAPIRALQYCEPFTAASGFGWYVFPPTDLSLQWDGEVIYWKLGLQEPWRVLEDPVPFPGLEQHLRGSKLEHILEQGLPPFIGRAFDAGLVQIWSGLIVRTRPGWSISVRPLANFPRDSRFEILDGLIETDWFFGPLVTPIRIRKTDEPIRLVTRKPLYQVQPLRTETFQRDFFENFQVHRGFEALSAQDYQRFRESLPTPGASAPGLYKSTVRERRKAEKRQAKEQDGTAPESGPIATPGPRRDPGDDDR